MPERTKTTKPQRLLIFIIIKSEVKSPSLVFAGEKYKIKIFSTPFYLLVKPEKKCLEISKNIKGQRRDRN